MNNEQVIAALADLVGTTYSEAVKACIAERTGRTRVVGPAEVATKEFDEKRINVIAGGNGVT